MAAETEEQRLRRESKERVAAMNAEAKALTDSKSSFDAATEQARRQAAKDARDAASASKAATSLSPVEDNNGTDNSAWNQREHRSSKPGTAGQQDKK